MPDDVIRDTLDRVAQDQKRILGEAAFNELVTAALERREPNFQDGKGGSEIAIMPIIEVAKTLIEFVLAIYGVFSVVREISRARERIKEISDSPEFEAVDPDTKSNVIMIIYHEK